jgi:tRNA threonylcarbamoyladenosine biosynthesis protein TsaE
MPILHASSFEFISRSVEQTRRVGMRLGAMLSPGDVICLTGELGAGKTTLVQGISAGWGSLDPVTSPTFVLVNVYRRLDDQRLYHVDAYRLNSPEEAESLDLENLIEDGPLVIEWADRIEATLPVDHLTIAMQWIEENQRDMVFTASGEHCMALLTSFRKHIYGVS